MRICDLTDGATTAQIEMLEPDVRAKLFACVAAVTNSASGQDRVAAARKDVREKDVAHAAALEVDHKANPPALHKDALARVIAANNGVKLKRVKVNKETQAALAEADMALVEARSELKRASDELRTLEAAAGTAINEWRKCRRRRQPTKSGASIWQGLSRERARRVAAGLSAETPKIQPAHQSELDRVFAARGKVANRLPVFMGKR